MKMRKLILILATIMIATAATTQEPIFFDDIDYGGKDWHLKCGYEYSKLEDFNSSFWGGFYGGCYSGPCNWRVSSIKVPKGCKVILYDQPHFQGNSITFTSDQQNLVNVGWNDRTSSIRIYGNAQPDPTQQQQQQQRCGGNIVFLNRTNRTVYLYGANVSKYQRSDFYMCNFYIGSIAPGQPYPVFVPEGQTLNFSIYESDCTHNRILSQGVYQDCQAVGQYHTIDF